MAAVIVPARAGVLSAVGILAAARQVDRVASWATPGDHAGAEAAAARLGDETRAELVAEGADAAEIGTEVAFDCRYRGQSHELTVASVAEFGAEHRRRNGTERPGEPVEVIALRATARVTAPLSVNDLAAPARETGTGPCVLAEADCTIWVPAGWAAREGVAGALVLTRTGSAGAAPGDPANGLADDPARRR